jgi:hypothetical protein
MESWGTNHITGEIRWSREFHMNCSDHLARLWGITWENIPSFSLTSSRNLEIPSLLKVGLQIAVV